MDNITFEQLPQAVSLLIEKVGQLSSRIEDVLKKTTPQQTEHRRPLNLDEVATLLDKSASTIYAITSEKRIPYHKRGNKLYFLKMKSSDGLSREERQEQARKATLTVGLKSCATARNASQVP